MNFHNSKIMEFMGLIHAKVNWVLAGAQHSIIFSLKMILVKCIIVIDYLFIYLFNYLF